MSQNMEERIRQTLARALQPMALDIENESDRHAGHAGDNRSGESHFRVLVVSSKFDGMSRVERQRMVCDLLRHELEGGLHALALKTLTTDEYKSVQSVHL